MSDTEMNVDPPAEEEPRRSSRKRKQPENFIAESTRQGGKSGNKQQDKEKADGGSGDEDEEDDDEEDDDESEDEPAAQQPKRRKTAPTTEGNPVKRGRGRPPKAKPADAPAQAPAKRGRGRPKSATTTAVKPAKKTVAADATGGLVRDDNGLFNALVQPDLALEPFIEDWVADYQSSRGDSEKVHVQELVVFFFRCCGVGCDIDIDDAVDLDNTAQTMDDIHEEMHESKEVPVYPLISRNKAYKSFRKNLETLLKSLITHLAQTPYLYTTVTSPAPKTGPTTPLLTLLLKWLTPMSASPYRAIRHTSTLIALSMGTALCAEAKALENQLAEAMRKRDAEGRKGKKDKVVIKNFEASIRDLAGKKAVVCDVYLKDIVLAFFVHRYRDRDPLIRADCLREMGLFMKHYPEKFVNTEHLQYIDSGLTDLDPHARLEAIKALVPLYGPDTRITSMTTFTSRAVPRIIDMAVRDIDLRIRIQAIHVLCQLDASGVLQDEEEEQRYHMACLVFDREPRIRKAVAGLIRSMWEEQVEEMKSKDESEPVAGKKKKRKQAEEDDEDADDLTKEREQRMGWKTLAALLIQLSNQLSASQQETQPEDEAGTESQAQRAREVLSSVSSQSAFSMDTHASIAVDALWSEIPIVQDAEALLAFLVADQSVLEKEERPWALDEEEQTFLLKMLVAGGRKMIDADKHKRKEEDETETVELTLTRALIDTVPKLIAKHQGDPVRVSVVLELAGLMHLPVYAEMRATDAYERLWGDLIRQYLRHTDSLVLQHVLQLLRSLLATADLKVVNDAKLQELEENLVSNLNESIGDVDVGSSSLEEEQLHNIESAMLRLRMLFPQMDIRHVFDGDEGEASLWETILAIADRGKLGYKEEVKLVEHAMKIMVWYLSWTAVKVTQEDVDSETIREKIEKHRDETLRVLNEYAVGNHSNADEAVRREAVTDLLRFYVIFRPAESKDDAPASPCQTVLSVSMDDSLQYRCAGTIQAAIEKYIDHIGGKQPAHGSETSSVLSDLDEERPQKQKDAPKAPTPASIAYTAEFQTLIWSFISAMRAGVMESQHAGVLLKEYGRLDGAFDASLQIVVEILQDEGIYNEDGDMVSKVIGQALQESFEYHLDINGNADPTTTLGLAKLVSPAFFVHKSHFRLERKLAASNVIDFHEDGVAWCVRKYAALARSQNAVKDKTTKDRLKKRAAACLAYFKVLSVLTPALAGRDALRVKTRLAEILQDQAEITWRKAKGYDLISAYEKRLMSIASSDSVVKAASKAQQAREKDVEDAEEQGDGPLEPAVAPRTPKRPKAVRRTRANPDAGSVGEAEERNGANGDAEDTNAANGDGADEDEGEEDGGNANGDKLPEEPVDDQLDVDQPASPAAGSPPTSPAGSPENSQPDSQPISQPRSRRSARAPTASPAPDSPLRRSQRGSSASQQSEPASPFKRLTRASSVASFGAVEPTKRIRRR